VAMAQMCASFFKYLEMIGGVDWHEVTTERDDSFCGIVAEIVLIKTFSNEL
jgi:hypothetical protein